MSLKTPKTGLAKYMREWMKVRTGKITDRRFTINQLCEALAIPPGELHQKVAVALRDFERRGEITTYYNKKHNRRQYFYNKECRRGLWGKQNQIVFKAMYVLLSFAVTDIQRLAGIKERDGIDKMIRLLSKNGYLQQIARRHCAHGAGAENIYHIMNRDRFKLEIMKGN
jgi:hypothetical protein